MFPTRQQSSRRWKSNPRFLAAILLLAAASLFANPGTGAQSAEQELMQADRAFDQATAQKGLEGFLSFISDNVATIRPNEPIIRGRDEFGARWKDLLTTPGTTIHWIPEMASQSKSGDLGYTVGIYEITQLDKGGLPVLTGSGKYITIWRKQDDGSWKVVFDSGIQDRVKPAPATAQP